MSNGKENIISNCGLFKACYVEILHLLVLSMKNILKRNKEVAIFLRSFVLACPAVCMMPVNSFLFKKMTNHEQYTYMYIYTLKPTFGFTKDIIKAISS